MCSKTSNNAGENERKTNPTWILYNVKTLKGNQWMLLNSILHMSPTTTTTTTTSSPPPLWLPSQTPLCVFG